jgi:hypothetical protein
MKRNLLKRNTKAFLKNNPALRSSLPYKQATNIGIIFTVEDKTKHDHIKDIVRKLEQEGKQVTVMSYLPKDKDNYGFLFDFFTEKDLSFWGSITSENALRFADIPFDFLFYFDVNANPMVMNIIARSKAKCRVGKYFEQGQEYFELMLEAKDDTKLLIDSLYQYTSKLK